MAQICFGVKGVNKTVSHRIYRRKIIAPFPIANIDYPFTGKEHAVSTVTCRHHTIEHIHTTFDRLEQIDRSSYAHQITRSILRQNRIDQLDHFIHYRSWLTYCQSANRIAIRIKLLHELCRTGPQIRIGTPLNDREQGLIMAIFRLGLFVLIKATLQPTWRPLPRLLGITVLRITRRAFIECHHDIGSYTALNIDHILRRKHMQWSVDVRMETAPLFG